MSPSPEPLSLTCPSSSTAGEGSCLVVWGRSGGLGVSLCLKQLHSQVSLPIFSPTPHPHLQGCSSWSPVARSPPAASYCARPPFSGLDFSLLCSPKSVTTDFSAFLIICLLFLHPLQPSWSLWIHAFSLLISLLSF